jgi:lipopolysaccharide transport system permease protein
MKAHLAESSASPRKQPTRASRSVAASSLPIDSSHRVKYFRDLLWVLVERDMKLRYKGSLLGLLWTLVIPLSQLLVFYFVFGVLFKVSIPRFPVFLFVGIVAWNWFSGAINQATSVFVDNRALARKPGFPLGILSVVTITSHLIHFLLTLPIVFGLVWMNGLSVKPGALLQLPLLLVCQFLLTQGIAYAVATVHVAYRDTQYLVNLGLMLGFYLTPIFYSTDMVPAQALVFYKLNPMAHLVDSYRAVFLSGASPSGESLLFLMGFAATSLGSGYLLYHSRRGSFQRDL